MSFTYNSLTSACVAAAEDNGTEFTDYLPTAIMLAQSRMFRDLDSYGLVTYASTQMSVGQPFVNKPSGTFIIKSFSYQTSDGSWIDLLMRTDEFIRDYWPIRSSVGNPKYYANWGYNQVIVAPTPVSAYPNEWSLVTMPSAISSVQQTNWFTDFASEALFYASMVEMMNFAKNPTMKGVWEDRYQDAKALLRNEARRTRRDDQTPNASDAGADDNLNPAPAAAANN